MRMVYLDLDTLRPDHLGCYGYPRPTSPNIDSLAEQGLRFDRLYTSDSPCLPSRSALQTGMFGIHNGAVGHGGTAAEPFNEGITRGFKSPRVNNSFASVLSRAGIWTTTISIFGQHHSALQWYAGFNEALQDGYNNFFSEGSLPMIRDWIARNAATRENWFLHVHVWDPHTPYIGTAEMAEALGDGRPDWITEEILEEHRALAGPHSAQETMGFAPSEGFMSNFALMPSELTNLADVDLLIDGYDTGIKRADTMTGIIMNDLADLGILDDTAILVSSDHGENFGELGVYADHHTADEYTHRLPGVLVWPGLDGVAGGRVDSGNHYQLDLAASILELAGAEVPGNWDGESFADSLRSGDGQDDGSAGRDRLVLSHGAWTVQRSLRWDDWLCIFTMHDGYHGYPDVMLFDVAVDPHLRDDRADHEPALVADARARLAAWRESMLATSITGVDPLDTVLAEGGPFHVWGELPEYLERLRATGRAPIADQLEARWPDAAAGGGPAKNKMF
ncbi:MAG: choline-sulfatase [Candidatus Aldehydirespiratoraceae bacterium]|jgi:choline-sulfatase